MQAIVYWVLMTWEDMTVVLKRLTDPTQTRFPHKLHSEPKIRNFSLCGLKGSLVTKHSSSNLQDDSQSGENYNLDYCSRHVSNVEHRNNPLNWG